jgi:endonuclease/exonuclease/phosphatase family metal-dependent hydrolase
LVGTTHLLYNNNRGDIKFGQLDLVTQSLAMIQRYLTLKFEDYTVSTILAGDFNATSKSGVYQYMIEGKYDCHTQNRDEISGQA